jgi:hypothetical protein
MKLVYHFLAFFRQIKLHFRIKTFQKRYFLINKTGKKFSFKKQDEKILVVIAHVVPDAASLPAYNLCRLTACLDALGKSLASFESKIILLTKKGYSLDQALPDCWKEKVELWYSDQQDPMFVEYDSFEVFSGFIDSFDYFMFLEDDVLLNDSWFLEKIKKFNYYSSHKNFVLLPHRFEYCNGVKYFFDQMIADKPGKTAYNYSEILKVYTDDAAFVVYENPHAAFYCLSKEQLLLWKNSGYKWKNKVVAYGVLESAATYSLYENFEFLKPHPDNINYFEVQHYGNKYMLKHKVLQ